LQRSTKAGKFASHRCIVNFKLNPAPWNIFKKFKERKDKPVVFLMAHFLWCKKFDQESSRVKDSWCDLETASGIIVSESWEMNSNGGSSLSRLRAY